MTFYHALNSFQQHNGGAWHKKLWYDGMNGGQNNTNNNNYNKNHNTKEEKKKQN